MTTPEQLKWLIENRSPKGQHKDCKCFGEYGYPICCNDWVKLSTGEIVQIKGNRHGTFEPIFFHINDAGETIDINRMQVEKVNPPQ